MSRERLASTVEGPEGAEAIVFVHGRPDDGGLWHRQVDALKQRFRCVSVTLPNFGVEPDRSGAFSFDELVQRLEATIDDLEPTGEPVLLVTHDWGAYLGYLFAARHPSRLRRMVAMDIGANPAAHGIKQVLLTVAYQWHLVGSWLLGGILPSLGRLHAQGMARLMGVSRERRARLKSRFCYPYWVLWTDLVLPWRRKNLQRGYRPRCPVLFLYGDRKALMFHSERWLVVRLTTRARDHSVMRRRQQSQ